MIPFPTDTGDSTWFFQEGNIFPLKPQDSPSPLGPRVTSRDGTCVHHPGYCHEARLNQSSINYLRFVLQHDTVYRSALYYQKNGRGSCVPEIILSPSRTARLHRECSSTGHDSFSNAYALMASSLPILKAACMSKRSASLRDDTDSIRLAS